MNWHHTITNWHKATRTHHEEDACVEIGVTHGVVGIRDTKHQIMPTTTRPVVIVSSSTFASFLDGVRS
ncbi:MAG: hypothetical protein JWQ81_1643 [Amycolatopsis sp.]|jgi:hypothetical protein|uniref:DUF397 domain-containing protein n=1 Tax=Amycolatopsis sp. TaxID=37632 RepID=UPI0026265E3B|nr:DUF397 domain-containing protein [Amycolatopsis sp.]MCU1680904.1 hypothetical protein [Amycolatopsis sp.]